MYFPTKIATTNDTELQYSIYQKRMLASAPEDSSLPDPQEPTEIDELNFEVL